MKKEIKEDEILKASNEFYSSTVETYDEEEEEEEEYDYDEDDYSSNEKIKRKYLKKPNMKLLYQWSDEIFEKEDIIADGEVCNLMGFLLMWMLNLIDPIVPKSMANTFIETFAVESSTINDFNDFIDDLPLLHKNTLKYIIGFLREIAKNEKLTLENHQTIADTIASFFVCTSFTTVDPFTRIKLIDIAPRFLLFCLDSLDVTDVYPLNPIYEIRK